MYRELELLRRLKTTSSNSNSKSDEKPQYKFKIPLFGSQNTGKTSLILRYIKDTFKLNVKQTIGTNFLIKDVEIKNAYVRLLLWDIGGQAQFSTMRNIYFKGSQGAIGVYDITAPESLLRLPGWVSTLKKSAGEVPLVLIGNKVDLAPDQRRVSKEDALDLAKRLDAKHFETSAKTGENVEDMFLHVANMCYKIAKENEEALAQ